MNYENDDHQHSEYQRQTAKYRCGRAARWGAPCWQGPDARKKCGGTTECKPVKRGDRYYCQRPESAGGACIEGPLPDGSCAHTHPPCRPRANIRYLRGRLALLGILFIIILVAIFSSRDGGNNLMINPGELSASHAGFPITDQCENCHKAHALPTTAWLFSAFEHEDMTTQCTQCHVFDGKADAPHNRQFKDTEKNTAIECISCHHEHKGADFDIRKVSNQTCSNCHENSFAHFSQHSPFPENFPHQQPQKIFFDHARHLSEYFVEEKWLNKPDRDTSVAEKAVDNCGFCHQLEAAKRDIPVRDYDITCAGCHDQQIKNRTMTVLTADDMSQSLLGLIQDDEDELESDEAAIQLIDDLADGGLEALTDKLTKSGLTEAEQHHLFKGLDAGMLQQTASIWRNEDEMDLDDTIHFGWQVAEDDDGAEALLYRPDGHADEVIRAWVELYLKKAKDKDDDMAGDTLLELLDVEEGPGACGKCHGTLAGNHAIDARTGWGRTPPQQRTYSSGFSHRPHIDLLGENRGCDACHKLSDDADYAAYFKHNGIDASQYHSGFNEIKMQVCTECHNSERISDDCQLCHIYHKGSGFKFEYQKRELKVINHE